MEARLLDLKAIVTDLVTMHNVKHSAIKDHVFEILKDLSFDKLDHSTILVLYNATYGGYGYSKRFEEFKREAAAAAEKDCGRACSWLLERTEDVKLIEAFGKACKVQYARVARMIATYNHYSLDDVFTRVRKIIECKETIMKLLEFIERVQEEPTRDFGTDTNVHLCLWALNMDKAKSHDKDSVLAYLYQKKTEVEKELVELEGAIKLALNISERSFVTFMRSSVTKVIFDDESAEEHLPYYQKTNWKKKDNEGCNSSFVEALNYYGESHFAIWKLQHYYDEQAMRFLLKYPDVLPWESIDQAMDECHDMEIGLLCASGGCCMLLTKEVPLLLDWRISEYDGMETVIVG